MSGPRPLPSLGRDAIAEVVDHLCADNNQLIRRKRHEGCRQVLPSRQVWVEIIEGLRSVLFPGYFGTSDLTDQTMRFHVGANLDRLLRVFEEQIGRGLSFTCEEDPACCPTCDERADQITGEFLARLPDVQRMLATDVEAAYEGDPAATCADEAIFAYPGIMAITNYRLAHVLYHLDVPLIPRIITEHAHSITGIDIHPGAHIGEKFFIDHGTGVVIGETCEIGERVRIYQGVTLGAKSFPLDENGKPIKGVKRHPVVEDDVIIYSGATILGTVRLGKGSVIGGNVWLTEDVPAGSQITQATAKQERFEGGAGI